MPTPTQSDLDTQTRAVALAWLELTMLNTDLNRMVDGMVAAGTPDASNWTQRANLPVAKDSSHAIDFARELVRRGAVSRDEVHDRLPSLLN